MIAYMETGEVVDENGTQLVENTGPVEKFLYLDIETIPDWSRFHQYQLEYPEHLPEESIPGTPVDVILEMSISSANEFLTGVNPPEEWISTVESAERSGKNRKGLLDALGKCRSRKTEFFEAVEKNKKIMATTPEMNQIVSIGWAIDDSPVESLVATTKEDERRMLEVFWMIIADMKAQAKVVGFNCINFDLPTLFARSIIQNVKPLKFLNLNRWSGDAIDLMHVRYPSGGWKGLKDLAKYYQIPIPQEGVDGSQVSELVETNPSLVGDYVESDVIITRELHRKFQGFFCR